eukprot:SAG31_NODE_31552_length_366_cov_244.254682_2_plen_37_part_01
MLSAIRRRRMCQHMHSIFVRGAAHAGRARALHARRAR